MADAFIGEVRLFGGTFAPVDWNFCDGTLLSISQYQALFSLIGTTYGGDGISNFKLPDLRGRLPIGTGQGTGLSAITLGEVLGSETVTLTSGQMPMHNHLVQASTVTNNPTSTPGPTVSFGAVDTSLHFYVDTSVGHVTGSSNFSPNAVSYSGGNSPHENRMPCQAINYIICLNGIFPSPN